MKKTTDTYLLLKQNPAKAVAVLYERYGSRLFAYARKNWKLDEDNATDIVYEVLRIIVEKTSDPSFESEEHFKNYVFRTFINRLKNHLRDTKRKEKKLTLVTFSELSMDDKTPQNGYSVNGFEETEELPSESPAMAMLTEELEKMQDWERMLVLLRAQDTPYSEIEALTGKPASQLKVYYQRLKEKLAKKLNEKMNAKTISHE